MSVHETKYKVGEYATSTVVPGFSFEILQIRNHEEYVVYNKDFNYGHNGGFDDPKYDFHCYFLSDIWGGVKLDEDYILDQKLRDL